LENRLEDMATPPEAVKALLIVDAQAGLLDGDSAVPSATVVSARLGELLAAARAAGSLVVHLQNDGAPGSTDEPGSPGWAIHASAAPRPGETVVRKTRDDGFDGTGLEDVFAVAGVRRIAVAGVQSEMCVSATIRGALARGFEVVLVRDAHATHDVEDIPSAIVSRVAEHALGDEIDLAPTAAVTFIAPTAST
jgi:nicotinamidase-related amidase